MSRFLLEFWDEGRRRSTPAFPLGLTRILFGLFWLSQLQSTFPTPLVLVLTAWTGVSLLLGFLTKLGALTGAVLAIVLARTVASGDPLWPYALLVVVHLLLLVTRAGQNWGIDQILMVKLANWPSRRVLWLRRVTILL